MDMKKLASALRQGASAILRSDEACLEVAGDAEDVARYVAQHLSEREDLVDLEDPDDEIIFNALSTFWAGLASSFDPSSSHSGLNPSEGRWASEDSRTQLALALAKLERNLVAGLQPFQAAAEQHEADIRKLVFNVTTFVRIADPKFFTLQAVLAQLLCNLISPASPASGADRLADKYLRLYLSGNREDDVIIRLLDSRDSKTNHATLHLLNNVIRDSPARLYLLLTDVGVRWCAKVLGRMDEWVEAENGLFELGASIFNTLISTSLHARLFQLLSDSSEPITPSQTTLLKILDSHLASSPDPTFTPSPGPHLFLIPLFHQLVRYTSASIGQGADDPRLPKVFEGLILVTEGLNAIGLAVQGRKDRRKYEVESGVSEHVGDEEVVEVMKSPVEGKGVAKPTIALLRSLDTFFPRVNPRSQSSLQASSSSSDNKPTATEELKPFANLKRNLVQLIGVLSFEDTAVGDQVREVEGIQLLLSMTEIDEGNPYLREHALLCVRNLMLNNPANQAIITQMDPIGVLSDDTGELLPLPDKMKKQERQ
ncbi:hypothetical protein I316_00077 [Kwoniella heveanensis BCC8398]|uniref:Ataxin-10 homolog n=1 Tax=Kwoniella heveanensis BCC8398 TaxID=1296120 RepID=A0A1B9H3J7_9TREE|nr:hypothetical protein I316_00077 [Kwoniella heveanensis BCC8398]